MQTKSVTVTKTFSVAYPDVVSECSFTFVNRSGTWFCQVTSQQGTKEYAVTGNVTGAEGVALASAAGKFLALYQADVNAGAV